MASDNELLQLEDLNSDQLSAFISQLIEKDFSRLVQILYRLDVSETKLKKVLEEHPAGDAGEMIAGLIAERIEQSKRSRELFKQQGDIPEDEKW